MTKTKVCSQTKDKRPWGVEFSEEQLTYLSIPTKQGASRLNAYLHLMKNAVETGTPYKPQYGQSFNLESGQLVVSITDLADRWKWARETVRKFLDQLVEFDLMSKISLDRCSLLSMKMGWLDEFGECSTIALHRCGFNVPDWLDEGLDEWFNETISDSEFGELLDESLSPEENENPALSMYYIRFIQFEMIRSVVRTWIAPQECIGIEVDKTSEDILSQMFNGHLSGNWTQWVEFLGTFRPKQDSELGDATAVEGNEAFENCRALLRTLLTYLKVDFSGSSL